jgi:uncharacterized membrane protein (DUF106 family)
MDSKRKEGSFMPLFIVMTISLLIAFFWNSFPIIKDNVHKILDPSAGALLNWNVNYGFVILIFIITFITTLAQKYFTDQKAMKEIKEEQKKLNEDLKKLERGSKEYNELSMKSLQFFGPMMKLSTRPMMFIGVPLILFYRWFMDVFTLLGNPKFFGVFSWFWYYLILSLIISTILRKVLKVE